MTTLLPRSGRLPAQLAAHTVCDITEPCHVFYRKSCLVTSCGDYSLIKTYEDTLVINAELCCLTLWRLVPESEGEVGSDMGSC